MTVCEISRNTSPLCFMPDGRLVCYSKGHVMLINDGTEAGRIPVAASKKEMFLGWSRHASRLFRLGIRTATAIDDENILFSVGNSIYEANLTTGMISCGWYCGDGVRPLAFSTVKGINGFIDGIYFGGYLQNNEKQPVSIYLRKGEDCWDNIFTFPEGEINHVHNIIEDSYRDCLWIFTGDFGDAAAIWKVSNGFKKVERVAYGNQKWRGCVAFALPEGLLYATDAPFADDFIYLLNPESMVLKELFPIHGSCIYGCQWKNQFVFSSTVEADGRDETIWKLLFSRKRGSGIVDTYVRMYIGNPTQGFKVVYKEKKDWLPFIFQFGAFRFPTGVNNSDTLYFQPVAAKHDGILMAIEDSSCARV